MERKNEDSFAIMGLGYWLLTNVTLVLGYIRKVGRGKMGHHFPDGGGTARGQRQGEDGARRGVV